MGRLLSVVGAVVLLAVAAPSAHGAPVALLDAPRAQDIALSADEVLVGRPSAGGGVRVDALPASGGAVRRLLSAPPPRPGWKGAVQVAASTETVAALVHFDRDDGLRESQVYGGPPAGPLALLSRVRWSPRNHVPFAVDASGDRILVNEARLRDLRFSARVLAPGGAVEPVPWPGVLLPPAALAGERVAFVGSSRGDSLRLTSRVFVIGRRSGSVEATVRLRPSEDVEADDLDLAPDGRVIVAADGALLSAAPGVSQTRLPGMGFTRPRFAGPVLAALQEGRFGARRPVVLAAGAGAPRSLGSPSGAIEALEADDDGVAWLANGCVLHSPRDGQPPGGPPIGPCPRSEVLHEEGDQVLRGRRLGVVVTCIAAPASGCRGSVLLGRRGTAGRSAFRLAPGTRRTVDVELTPRGLRRARRGLRNGDLAFFELGARVRDGRSHGTGGVLVARRRAGQL